MAASGRGFGAARGRRARVLIAAASTVAGLAIAGSQLRAPRTHVPAAEAMRARAQWLRTDDPDRDRAPDTRRVLDALALRPGLAVADVGSGGGYFTFRIAQRVGPSGRVLATDADAEAVAVVEREAAARRAANVSARQVTMEATGLERDAYDRVLLVNVFPFLTCFEAKGRAYLGDLVGALRPGGELLLFHDGVNGPDGRDPRPCWQPDGATVASWLPEDTRVVALERVEGSVSATRKPGYLLRVRRAGRRVAAGDAPHGDAAGATNEPREAE
jgi:SAM-dependent methyltransferase